MEGFMYFKQLLRHYQDQLQKDKGIKEKLRDLGDIQWDNLKLLEVGYSSQESELPLSKKMIDSLKAIGFLDSNGKEHFEGFLTVPLMQESQKITGLYGFNPSTRESKVLYQDTGITGFPFPKVLNAYSDQLYLASDVFDAISIMNLGIKNVTFLRSQDEFFNGQYEAICSHGVKDIILLLQRDENFQEPPSKLKEKLQKDGVNVRVVYPTKPNVLRWSDDVASGLTVEGFKRAVSASTELQGISDEPAMVHSQDGIEHTFEFKHLSYSVRISNLAQLLTKKTNFKVIKAEQKHRDGVSLCSHSSRLRFSKRTGDYLDTEPKIIQNNLNRIIDWVEEELKEPGPKKLVLTKEEIRLAEEFAMQPDLLRCITEDIARMGYVGESLNIQLLYLAATSRITDDPISVLTKSESGSGKSKGMETVAILIPPEDVIRFTDLSEKSLLNATRDGLLYKLMIIDEMGYCSKKVANLIRQMISSNTISSGVTGYDPRTGERVLLQKVVKTIISLVSSTTRDINPENESRMFIIFTNLSKEQTRAIHEAQLRRFSLDYQKLNVDEIIQKHHAFQRILKPYKVIFPPDWKIDFPPELIRSRRDYERYLNVIKNITLLHQYQRERIIIDNEECLVSSLQDYELAYNLMIHVLSSTYSELPQQVVSFYENIRKAVKAKAYTEGIDVLDTGLRTSEMKGMIDGCSRTRQRYLDDLVESSYLKRKGAKKRGCSARYYLMKDSPCTPVDLSGLTTPEELKRSVEFGECFPIQGETELGQVG